MVAARQDDEYAAKVAASARKMAFFIVLLGYQNESQGRQDKAMKNRLLRPAGRMQFEKNTHRPR